MRRAPPSGANQSFTIYRCASSHEYHSHRHRAWPLSKGCFCVPTTCPIERVCLSSVFFFRPRAPHIEKILVCDASIPCAHDGSEERIVQRFRLRPAFAARGWEVTGSGVEGGDRARSATTITRGRTTTEAPLKPLPSCETDLPSVSAAATISWN